MNELKGRNIALRPLTAKDGTSIYSWVQDKEVVRYSLSKWQKQYTLDEFDNWFTKTLVDPQNINLAIIISKEDRLIGYAGFCSLDRESKKAEYFIFIGDKNEWGKGYGTEVTQLTVHYGFKELGLEEIMLTVSEPNIGGIRAYERAGFTVTGRIKNATSRDGVYHDKIKMRITAKQLYIK